MGAANSPFPVRRLTPNLGAEISGVVLSENMDDDVFRALYQAFLRYQVLLFPPQDVPPARQVAFARRFGEVQAAEAGAFKVPTLRHLMLTAPYGHDGKRETLADVVRHYSEKGSAALPALKLTAAEQTDLVVFLESISTLSNPWRPEDHGRCQ